MAPNYVLGKDGRWRLIVSRKVAYLNENQGLKKRRSKMAELEGEEEREKVPVPKREQKVEQELPEKALEPGEQWEIPRRWHTY